MISKSNKPEEAVAGLADMLFSLGEELRRANFKVGEMDYGGEEKDPILFLGSAEVEIELAVTTTVEGGMAFWVLSAEADQSKHRTARIKLQLNTGSTLLPVGA